MKKKNKVIKIPETCNDCKFGSCVGTYAKGITIKIELENCILYPGYWLDDVTDKKPNFCKAISVTIKEKA